MLKLKSRKNLSREKTKKLIDRWKKTKDEDEPNWYQPFIYESELILFVEEDNKIIAGCSLVIDSNEAYICQITSRKPGCGSIMLQTILDKVKVPEIYCNVKTKEGYRLVSKFGFQEIVGWVSHIGPEMRYYTGVKNEI